MSVIEGKNIIVGYNDESLFDDMIKELISAVIETLNEEPDLYLFAVKHYTDHKVPLSYIEVFLRKKE